MITMMMMDDFIQEISIPSSSRSRKGGSLITAANSLLDKYDIFVDCLIAIHVVDDIDVGDARSLIE
jgi:hypothetical protein